MKINKVSRFSLENEELGIPDEEDLVLWTEAEVAVSAAAAELLKREDRRVSRLPKEDAPPVAVTPPEALAPLKLLVADPELELLVAQES